ncbi:cupredoxin domain-containing protein [Streptomyces sp. UNOC14_S4]|nr:cupredoxin domain-containing protein [Streptomyces sp. UNOC14_S4]
MTPATVATAPVSAAPARAATAKVTIVGYAFSPSTLNVTRGTTVTWTNNDSAPHTVTSTGSGPLRSPTLNRGGSYTYTFTSSGTYGYICTIHPSMHGTVVVR